MELEKLIEVRPGSENLCPSNSFEPFGLSADEVRERFLYANIPAAAVERGLGDDPRFADCSTPVGPGEPAATLLVWPTSEQGIMSLVDQSSGGARLTAAWPFSSAGSHHDIKVERIETSEDRLQAIVHGRAGETPVAWYDTTFVPNRSLYRKGAVHRVSLHAFAWRLQLADQTPDRICLASMRPETRAAFEHTADAEGYITIEKAGMTAMLPVDDDFPNFHMIRGPVKRVEQGPGFLRFPTRRLVVAIGRLDEEHDLDVAVTVPHRVLGPEVSMKVGDDVEGTIWLEGRLVAADAGQPHDRRE